LTTESERTKLKKDSSPVNCLFSGPLRVAIRRFFLCGAMSRIIFLVDGFNLYHSLVDAERAASHATTKWLDLRRFCSSYLPVARTVLGDRVSLERIYYFSALPTHRSQGKRNRHALYMRCLRGTGVNVELARFKPKDIYCPRCDSYFVSHEEKETDVAIAARLFEVCQTDEAETIILMTGDTDLAPAVRTCKRVYANKLIFFAFPYKRTEGDST